MTTTKVMTDYGEISITLRNGYYYAIRTLLISKIENL